MTVAYVHHYYYFAPIRLIIYLVVFGVIAIFGAIARRSRRRNIGQYGQTPQQWQQGPPPGSPYGGWNGQSNQPSQPYGQPYGQQPPPQGYQPPYGGAPQQEVPPQGYGQQVQPPSW